MDEKNRPLSLFLLVLIILSIICCWATPGHCRGVDRATKSDISSLTRAIWAGIYNTTASGIRLSLSLTNFDLITVDGSGTIWLNDVGITGDVGIIGDMGITGNASVSGDIEGFSDLKITGSATFGDADTTRTQLGAVATQTLLDHTGASTGIHGSGADTRFLTASETILDAQIPAGIARYSTFGNMASETATNYAGKSGANVASSAFSGNLDHFAVPNRPVLGDAASATIGTSGDAVPKLNATGTWSAAQYVSDDVTATYLFKIKRPHSWATVADTASVEWTNGPTFTYYDNGLLFVTSRGGGQGALFLVCGIDGTVTVTILSDPGSDYAITDTGGKICVLLTAGKLTIKNNTGAPRNMKVAFIGMDE